MGAVFLAWNIFLPQSYLSTVQRSLVILKAFSAQRKKYQELRDQKKKEGTPLTFKQKLNRPKEVVEEMNAAAVVKKTEYESTLNEKFKSTPQMNFKSKVFWSSILAIVLSWSFIAFIIVFSRFVYFFYLSDNDLKNKI